MVVLTSLRQSPAYLYVKAYCLCALVTLFQATPVSSRIHISQSQLLRHARGGLRQRQRPLRFQADLQLSGLDLTQNYEPPRTNVSLTSETAESRVLTIFKRWYQRALDLAQVKALLNRDDNDLKTYPELEWDAQVRHSSTLHPKEKEFIELRKKKISSIGDNALHRFLDLPPGEVVDPRDVPLVALGGSGGGYRAMYGFTAFISAAQRLHLWDCITWVAGVSGSCWTIAAYYTIARHDISRLVRHYITVAKEMAHPLSIWALDTVARSKRGVYFLIGPLVRKAQTSIIGLGIMDLYATLTTTYQFLSREPKGRLSRATFQWSKVWRRSGINEAVEPFPILTAVRRVPRYTYKSRSISINDQSRVMRTKGTISSTSQKSLKIQTPQDAKSRVRGLSENRSFDWFEISPLEIGSPDLNRYIPTWSWGRTFISGHSVDRRPEQSLALLLGQCTSAPAGPLTGYISTLLATLPTGTVMSRILSALNKFMSMKRWERLWANPIRAGHDPNPFYGPEKPLLSTRHAFESRGHFHHENSRAHGQTRSINTVDDSVDALWEAQGRIRLMDGGVSNNLPNHVLARPGRGVDIFISFDASSDCSTGTAIKRLHEFARECRVKDFKDETHRFKETSQRTQPLEGRAEGSQDSQIEKQYLGQYGKVFRGMQRDGREIYVVHCPLIPNRANPDYNPSKASFSTSYNLVWSPEQINSIIMTSEANLTLHAVHLIRRVVGKVYHDKKARRLGAEGQP